MTITKIPAKIDADTIAVVFKNEKGEIVNRYVKTKAELEAQLAAIPDQKKAQLAKLEAEAGKAAAAIQADIDFLAA